MSNLLNAVLDTNVLIAALRSRNGASFELLRRPLGSQAGACISPLPCCSNMRKLRDVKRRLLDWTRAKTDKPENITGRPAQLY